MNVDSILGPWVDVDSILRPSVEVDVDLILGPSVEVDWILESSSGSNEVVLEDFSVVLIQDTIGSGEYIMDCSCGNS